MKTFTTTEIKNRLDEILRDYLSADQQIADGLSNNSGFYNSDRYFELLKVKDEKLKAHHKLTDALVAIESYM